MIMGVGFMILVLFGMVGPFIIQVTYHLSAVTYGYLALLIGIAYFSGSIVSRLCARLSGHAILQNSFLAMILFSLVFWILSLVLHQVWIYVVYVFLINFLMGLVYPACMTVTMSLFQDMSGTASAIMGAATMCIAGILSVIIGHIHLNSVPAVIVVYLVLAIFSFLLYWGLLKSYFVTR
jgi:MFS transporter, DHA1 family, multidrug resistance protein